MGDRYGEQLRSSPSSQGPLGSAIDHSDGLGLTFDAFVVVLMTILLKEVGGEGGKSSNCYLFQRGVRRATRRCSTRVA